VKRVRNTHHCLLVWVASARNELIRTLSFRANALTMMGVEILWFAILLVFYDTLFSQADGTIAGWSRAEFVVFVGCYFALEGTLETFVLRNCADFADLVRTGQLDAVLAKPADTQFLVTLRQVDLRAVPNIVLGLGTMVYGVAQFGSAITIGQMAAFTTLFAAALLLAYSLLVALMSVAVFTVRQQSLHELWWLLTTFWRNPPEIFERAGLGLVVRAFTYILPFMLIVQVPTSVLVARVFDPTAVAILLVAALVATALSRWIFFRSLRHYTGTGS
jgi:ABC-2 type transport system permease protein